MNLSICVILLFGSLPCFSLYATSEKPSPIQSNNSLSFKKHTAITVKRLSHQNLKHKTQFKGLIVGGLSALSFHPESQKFFALSDDKKNHRIYQFSLIKKPKISLKLENHILLHTKPNQNLPFALDPEGLQIGHNKTFYIASEGQQIFKTPDPPQIFLFSFKGLLKQKWPTPSLFWDSKNQTTHGAQENKAFESLSLNASQNILWVATEQALLQDLKPNTKEWVRLSAFKTHNQKLVTQYSYPLQSATGLTDMIVLKNKLFLTLERSYDMHKKSNAVFLFFTNCQKASNVVHQKKLTQFRPCSKQLLWSSQQEKQIKIDNLEGMSLGPFINFNTRFLILVSDNNFNPTQKTQFLFFQLKMN